MRKSRVAWTFAIFCICLFCVIKADEYRLMDGTRIWGRVSAFNEEGVIFRLDAGGFSERIPWSRFDQESLKKMAEDEKLRPFAEPFIEPPPEARPKPKPIVVREPPTKVPLPVGEVGLARLLVTPLGLTLLLVLYIGNLWAAYEIAIYKNRPVAFSCGLAAILPGIAPMIFLASPGVEESAETPPQLQPAAATSSPGGAGATSRAVPTARSGLRLAASQSEPAATVTFQKRVYDRSKYRFERQFIEREFRPFFLLVRNPQEKDLVLVVRTPKQEIIAERISRITGSEIFLVPLGAGATEVRVRIGEISQIVVRHKDDRSRD